MNSNLCASSKTCFWIYWIN